MFNIVLDNLNTSNVWYPQKPPWYPHSLPATAKKPLTNIPKSTHQRALPQPLYYAKDFSIHTSTDGLDAFIYPVSMQEPYVQVRALILNQSAFGFWSFVSENVITGLREKRGWVIIDLHSEPISQSDFDDMMNALSDSSQFPNDRILINITSPHFADNKRVFSYPSFLELGCLIRELHPNGTFISACVCDFKNIPEVVYPHKRFLLLNNHEDHLLHSVFRKITERNTDSFLESSNDSEDTIFFSSRFLLMPNAIYKTDLNVVIEAYIENDVIEYPFLTEKTYRNIKYKKPFILMGQQHTLAAFHNLGYKTFHPFVNESYDEIEDTKLRCLAVLRELDRLRQMNNTEWSNFLDNCKPIVEHNYNNLLKRIKQTNDWLEGLKDL